MTVYIKCVITYHNTRNFIKFGGLVVYLYCTARKFGRGNKFGSLAVYVRSRQIKIHQYFILAYVQLVKYSYITIYMKNLTTSPVAE